MSRIAILIILGFQFVGCSLILDGASKIIKGKAPAEAVDSISGYQQVLQDKPDHEKSKEYKNRLAELEYFKLQQTAQPQIYAHAEFYDQPGGAKVGRFAPHGTFVLDGYQKGWYSLRMASFTANMKVSPHRIWKTDSGTKPKDVKSLVSMQENGGTLSYMQFSDFELAASFPHRFEVCFLTKDENNCNNGYRFLFDGSRFTYKLEKITNSQSQSLCYYQSNEHNYAHARNISNAANRNGTRTTMYDLDLFVRNGLISASLNGYSICDEEDDTFETGHLRFGGHTAFNRLVVKPKTAANLVYVKENALVKATIRKTSLSRNKDGALYAKYNALAKDISQYQSAKSSKKLGGGTFSNSAFPALLKRELISVGAFEKMRKADTIEAYAKYKEKYPDNPYDPQIEARLLYLVGKKNTISGYKIFLKYYPDSRHTIAVKQRLGALRWESVMKGNVTKTKAKQFLKKYPSGFYSAYARQYVEKAFPYQEKNLTEHKKYETVIQKAQDALDRHPTFTDYNAKVLDFSDGNIFLSLRWGPNKHEASTPSVREVVL